MFVLSPDPYLRPCYRISPFLTRNIHSNHSLPDSNYIDSYFSERFPGKKYHYVPDGRSAINIALSHYQLAKDDVVTVLTTSQNFYISSCVTKEIEKFCSWSRQMEKRTKLVFINHEFGYPYKRIDEIQRYGLPIIEDCCHSFFSADAANKIGNVGDFVIYSFPKMFPLQIGGLLVADPYIDIDTSKVLQDTKLQYIKNVLSDNIGQRDQLIKQRIDNYHYLANALDESHFEERFDLLPGEVPGVFLFRVKNDKIDLPKLKEYCYEHGIQCSVFYGERSFFIPVHQNLEKTDLDYFAKVINSFASTES